MDGRQLTKLNEGLTLHAIPDTHGYSIGYGHDGASAGDVWTVAQADAAFDDDYETATANAQRVYGSTWAALDEVRQAVLTDMAYELGGAGLHQFVNMIAAIRANNWQAAHDNCLASAYSHQVPARAERNANMLLTGEWP
jgi:lysozyme